MLCVLAVLQSPGKLLRVNLMTARDEQQRGFETTKSFFRIPHMVLAEVLLSKRNAAITNSGVHRTNNPDSWKIAQ